MSVAITGIIDTEILERETIRHPYKRLAMSFPGTGDASGGQVTMTHIFRGASEPVSSDLVALERVTLECPTGVLAFVRHVDFDVTRGAEPLASGNSFMIVFETTNIPGLTPDRRGLRTNEISSRHYLGRLSNTPANTPAAIWQFDVNTDTLAYWLQAVYLFWDQTALQEGGILYPGDFYR